MKKQQCIKILLVCDKESDIIDIKDRVEELDDISCYVWQCPTLSEGINYLDIKKLRADIIILDLGLKGAESPKEIYSQINLSSDNIPIIVITGKGEKEHDLAIYVMEAGAADNMVRGEFSGLMDAMEFAMIRRKIIKKTKSEADKTLQDSKDIGDAKHLKQQQDHQDHLSMFMGNYSVCGNGTNDKKNKKNWQ